MVVGLQDLDVSKFQLDSARAAELFLRVYSWKGWKGDTVARIARELGAVEGFLIERAYLDVEQLDGRPVPDVAVSEIRAAVEECRKYVAPGIYSAKGVWQIITGDSQAFSGDPLWNAYYDGDPDVDFGYHPFGGWEAAEMEQWAENVELCGIKVDLNVYAA